MLKHALAIFLFAIICFHVRAQEGFCLDQQAQAIIEKAGKLLDAHQYDSLQMELSQLKHRTDRPMTDCEAYYVHCFEAEVMYYNALPEQGISSTYKALDLAKKIGDPALLGNAYNFLGLFKMNMMRVHEAIPYFKMAEPLLSPLHNNHNISFQYQVYNNLGECYVHLDKPDSTIFYCYKALEEIEQRKNMRGWAFAMWNISSSNTELGNLQEAISIAKNGLARTDTTDLRDVVQLFCSSLMLAYDAKGMRDSAMYWMRRGLDENERLTNTDFMRLEFMEEALDLCVRYKMLDQGIEILDELDMLNHLIHRKDRESRLEILANYLQSNEMLGAAQMINQQQTKALALRKWIVIIIVVLAVALIAVFIYGMINIRQRQRIEMYRLNESVSNTSRAMEVRAWRMRVDAITAERNRIASDLHDDIGASLSSIRIYGSAAEKHIDDDKEETRKLLERISKSSAETLDRMSDIVWSIQPSNDDFESLIMRMKTYASEVLAPLDIEVEYRFDERLHEVKMNIPARKNVYLFFKEAINNVAKYSGAKHTIVKMGLENGQFKMCVCDDGKGFDSDKYSAGNGLKNMRRRASLLKGQVSIESKVDGGTTVHFETDLKEIREEQIV